MGESMQPPSYWEQVEDSNYAITELTQVGRDVVMRCWNYSGKEGMPFIGPPTLLRIPDSYLKYDDKGQLEVVARTEDMVAEAEDGA